ncbi:hypothetical protein D3C80_1346250 [compost metagenome]
MNKVFPVHWLAYELYLTAYCTRVPEQFLVQYCSRPYPIDNSASLVSTKAYQVPEYVFPSFDQNRMQVDRYHLVMPFQATSKRACDAVYRPDNLKAYHRQHSAIMLPEWISRLHLAFQSST